MIRRPGNTNTRPDEHDEDEDEREYTPRTRKSREDDEDEQEDEPKRPPAARQVIKRGWAAADSLQSKNSPYAQSLKLSEKAIIVKFIEDEPYASFRQHWVERKGQKSFVCIDGIDPKGCPLCDANNRPTDRYSFNVVLLSAGGDDPVIKSYDVGGRVIDQLRNFHLDDKQGPLSKHYWAISRSGTGPRASTNHQMIRERDLSDYEIEPLSEADVRALRKDAYDETIVNIPSRKELLEIVDEL